MGWRKAVATPISPLGHLLHTHPKAIRLFQGSWDCVAKLDTLLPMFPLIRLTRRWLVGLFWGETVFALLAEFQLRSWLKHLAKLPMTLMVSAVLILGTALTVEGLDGCTNAL